MKRVKMMFVLKSLLIAMVLALPAAVSAEPCLIVYPTGPATYHYDPTEYYTVTYGHPLYDAMYDRGGEVLIDANTDEIALDIYQTPNLIGFEPSSGGNDGYFFIGSSFNLVVDGWSNAPTNYTNVTLMFDAEPGFCQPIINVAGNPISGDSYVIGDLAVSTPTANGNNYSDTVTLSVTWSGCYGVRIWAFADENFNGVLDGGECFTAFSHDVTVPVEERSWGSIKTLYE